MGVFNSAAIIWLTRAIKGARRHSTGVGLLDDEQLVLGNAADSNIKWDNTNSRLRVTVGSVYLDIASTGLHLADNTKLLIGNTAAAPDGNLYSNGTDVILEADNSNDLVISAATEIKGIIGVDELFTLDANGLLFEDNNKILLGATSSSPDGNLYSNGTDVILEADNSNDLIISAATEIKGIIGVDELFTLDAYGLLFEDNNKVLIGNTSSTPDGQLYSDGTDVILRACNSNDLVVSAATELNSYIGGTLMSTLTTRGLYHPDNKRVNFGNSATAPDGRVYSDGTDLMIAGTADVVIHAATEIKGIIGTDELFTLDANGLLFEDNNKLLVGNTSAAPDGELFSNGTDTVLQADNSNDLIISAATELKAYIGTTEKIKVSGTKIELQDDLELENNDTVTNPASNIIAMALTKTLVLKEATAAINSTPTGCVAGTVALECDADSKKIGYWVYDTAAYESVAVE